MLGGILGHLCLLIALAKRKVKLREKVVLNSDQDTPQELAPTLPQRLGEEAPVHLLMFQRMAPDFLRKISLGCETGNRLSKRFTF